MEDLLQKFLGWILEGILLYSILGWILSHSRSDVLWKNAAEQSGMILG